MSQASIWKLLARHLAEKSGTFVFQPENHPGMDEQTWRKYFVATAKVWKSRVGSHSQSCLMRLYKKEKNIRSPPKGLTGAERGTPGNVNLYKSRLWLCDVHT